MGKPEIHTQIVRHPLFTSAVKDSQKGVLQLNFGMEDGTLHTFMVGELGQKEIEDALLGGLTLAKPEDIPGA